MLHCELWPYGSLKSTIWEQMAKLKSNIVNQSQSWLAKVKPNSLNSSMVDYGKTKVKQG